MIDTDKNVMIVAKITEKLNKQCYVNPNANMNSLLNVRKICDFAYPPPPARSPKVFGKGILISV